MGNDQYYSQVSTDDSSDPLVGEKSHHNNITRAPPSESSSRKPRSLLTKAAIGSLIIALFVASVAVVSSAVVSYRLPSATAAALASSTPDTSATNTNTTVTNDDGTPVVPTPLEDSSDDSSAAVTGKPKTIYDHTLNTKSCGGTPEEARAAGCVFDVMMQLWTPPECMDRNLSERYLAQGNWTWYADPGAVRAYTDEEIRRGEHDVVYVAQSYHRHHCIFAWERLVRAMRNQAPLIEELISYDHVMHCRHKTLTPPEEGGQSVRGVVAPTGYTRCASYDVWINGLPANRMSSTD